jgi:hypothetical protein
VYVNRVQGCGAGERVYRLRGGQGGTLDGERTVRDPSSVNAAGEFVFVVVGVSGGGGMWGVAFCGPAGWLVTGLWPETSWVWANLCGPSY